MKTTNFPSTIIILVALAWFNIALGGEIHEAAKVCDVAKVRALLESKPDFLNNKDDFGKTPLFWAAISNHHELVRLLLEKGADANLKDNVGRRPFEQATNREIAALLQKHTTPPYVERLNDIQIAAVTGDDIGIKRLLDRNPDLVKTSTVLGTTPLHFAASKGHKEIVALLLGRRAVIDARDLNGSTPLHTAAGDGFTEVVELLLKGGADLNAKDNQGRTPLHNSAQRRKPDVAELLLNRGADPNVTNLWGATPLHESISIYPNSDAAERNKKIARLLISKGADVNARTDKGWTPLHMAIDCRNTSVLHVLLANKADVDIKTKDGKTAAELLSTGLYHRETDKRQILELLSRRQETTK